MLKHAMFTIPIVPFGFFNKNGKPVSLYFSNKLLWRWIPHLFAINSHITRFPLRIRNFTKILSSITLFYLPYTGFVQKVVQKTLNAHDVGIPT